MNSLSAQPPITVTGLLLATPKPMLRILFISIVCSYSQFVSAAPLATSPSEKLIFEMGSGPGSVESFSPTKPKLFVVHGKGESPRGKFVVENGKVTGSAKFRLDSLDTGIPLRNTHLRDKYLDTKKYPEAELTLEPLVLPDSFRQSSSNADIPFTGILSLHGEKNPIAGRAKIKRSGSKLTLTTEFALKLTSFGVEKPGFAGVSVDDDVKVVVQSAGELQ